MKFEFDVLKPQNLTRVFITGLIFLTLCMMFGWDFRECQQVFLVCGIVAIVSLWLKNIWLTGFVLLSVVSFINHGFGVGQVYLSNIFFGMVLYIFTGVCFKKEHIDKYLNVFLWFVVLNLGYMASQLSGWDFIFKMRMSTIQNGWEAPIESNDPCGFMAFRSAAGMLMAMAIPVIMTRPWKLALPLGILMLFPIALSSASIAVIAGIFAILFCMYQKRYFVRKWNNIIIASLALALLVGGAGYATKKDDALKSFGDRACQWKLVLRDSMVHPIAGWGMDSFRNTTKDKKWQYAQHYEVLTGKKGFSVDYWDNPHNLFVSLAFEWGWIGVFLVIGYFVDLTRRFRLSYSSSNTTALYGVLMVTLILSISHFPVFLARFMCFIIPMAAMLEITMRTEDGI